MTYLVWGFLAIYSLWKQLQELLGSLVKQRLIVAINKVQKLTTLAVILSDTLMLLIIKPDCSYSLADLLFRVFGIILFQFLLIGFLYNPENLKKLISRLIASKRIAIKKDSTKKSDSYLMWITLLIIFLYIVISILMFYFAVKGTYIAGGEAICL